MSFFLLLTLQMIKLSNIGEYFFVKISKILQFLWSLYKKTCINLVIARH